MQHEQTEKPERIDFARNWVSSSRFLFHVQIFTFTAMLMGGCYGLYSMRYKGKPQIEVPESSLYSPKYK